MDVTLRRLTFCGFLYVFLQLCRSPELSNKKLYSTFIRTYAQSTKIPEFLFKLLDYFKWTTVGILFEKAWINTFNDLKKKLKEIVVRIEEQLPDSQNIVQHTEKYNQEVAEIMKRIKNDARSKLTKTTYHRVSGTLSFLGLNSVDNRSETEAQRQQDVRT